MNFKQLFVALSATALFMPFGVNAQSWDINGNPSLPLGAYFGSPANVQIPFKSGGQTQFQINDPSNPAMNQIGTGANYFATNPNAAVLRVGLEVTENAPITYGGAYGMWSVRKAAGSTLRATAKGGLTGVESWHAGGSGWGIGGSIDIQHAENSNSGNGYAGGMGGSFGANLDNATLISAASPVRVAGVSGSLSGTIARYPQNGVLTALFANDEINNAQTWAGYFNGKGKFTGKVVMGDVPMVGNYNLYVENGILTEKVKVALKSTTQWADFVFASQYKLRSLSDVETFIKRNHHLPDVPSAEKVAKDGLDLADMMKIQMQKIEELTLYIIAQQKEIDALKAKAK
jgi:hypothetical protein